MPTNANAAPPSSPLTGAPPRAFRAIRSYRNWGRIVDYLWIAGSGEAFALSVGPEGGVMLFAAASPTDPEVERGFDRLSWFAAAPGPFALDAWRHAVARAGAGS